MRGRLRTRLAGRVEGLFVITVRCLAASEYVLVVRAVSGDGEIVFV